MFCKWCGLESDTNDICSWCQRPFATAASRPAAAPASPEPPATPQSTAPEPPRTLQPSVAPPVQPGAVPLGFVGQGLDDDLSPIPFAPPMAPSVPSAYSPPPRPVQAPPAWAPPVDSRPAAPPPAVRATPPAPASPIVPPTPVPVTEPVREVIVPPVDVAPQPVAQPVIPVAPPVPTATPAAPQVVTQPSPAPVQVPTPIVASPAVTVPPVAPPSVAPPAPVPLAPSQPAPLPQESAPLEAIPVRRSGGTGAVPDVIPISRRSGDAIPIRPPGGATAQPTSGAIPIAPPVAPPSVGPAAPPAVVPVAPRPAPVSVAPPKPIVEPPAPPVRTPDPVTAPTIEAADISQIELQPLAEVEPEDEPAIMTRPGGRVNLGGGPLVSEPTATPPPPPAQPTINPLSRVPVTTVHIPKGGGLTYYCKWCGMDSENSARCTWCHKPISNTPVGGPASATPGKGPIITGSHGKGKQAGKQGGRRAQPVPAKPAAPAGTASKEAPKPPKAPVGTPALGTFQATKSKYYEDQVVDTVSGTHYNTETGEAVAKAPETVEDLARSDRDDLVRSIGIYVAGLLGTVAVLSAGTYFLKDAYLAFLAVGCIGGGLALPLLRIVPFGEDDSSDLALALALFIILGPFIGGMVYGIICLMKQDANPAIVGIFLTYLLVRIPLSLAVGQPIGEIASSLVAFQPVGADAPWSVFVAERSMTLAGIVGWYSAAMFHKPDE